MERKVVAGKQRVCRHRRHRGFRERSLYRDGHMVATGLGDLRYSVGMRRGENTGDTNEREMVERRASSDPALTSTGHCHRKMLTLQPSQKTFRIKQKLAKKARQNRPVPQWFRLKTDSELIFHL